MRLVCPNCDAEYEVDDAAIPREGRDVQCSNCGHAWFQAHPEVEIDQEAEADLYDAPPGAIEAEAPEAAVAEPEPVHAPVVETVIEAPPPPPVLMDDEEDDDEESDLAPMIATAPAAAPEPAKPRTLDETVLAVLREEAEREAAARKAEAQPVIESQTEMPLAPAPDAGGMVAAVQRIARLRGLAPETAAEPATAITPDPEPEPEPAPKSRGNMFPAIEEINSTLRAVGDRGQDEDDAIVDTLPDLTKTGGGLRRGFLTVVLLAMLIVALYLLAPTIGARVPALEGVARAYVVAIDAARVWLDVNLRALVAMLRGLAGGQGG